VPTNANVIGFVGRLTRDKGIPALIEAFDRVLEFMPQSYLLLVGWFDEADDALDSRVRERITRHPRIICTGFVEDTAPYYRAMDLLVLPTQREGFPNAVLEASATGIPVITTPSTGACDSVVDGVTGMLVPGDPGSICEAIVKLLRDPDERARMGSAGRAWVLEHFTDQRLFGLTTSFYKSLLRPGTVGVHREEPAMDLAVRLR
jgi:glycosyltransferase involved in cell wall biosynthesis